MSATRMLVLGIIRWSGAAHGYQVRSELLGWGAQEWARINPGSIYHAIRKAAADGLLVEVPEDGREAGPDRMRYAVTEAGYAQLLELIRAGLRDTREPYQLNAALAMLPMLSRGDAVALLHEREARLADEIAELESFGDAAPNGSPAHVVEQFRLWLAQLRANLTWTSELRGRLLDGVYQLAGED